MQSGFVKIVVIGAVLIVALLSVSLLKRSNVERICNLDAVPFVLALAALTMVMMLTSFAYYDVYAARYDELENGYINATVVSVESRTNFGATYEVQINSRDGKSERARGLIGSDSTTVNVGDVIEVDVEFCKLNEFYTYRNASRTELLSKGVVFTANTVGEPVLCGQSCTVTVFLAKLRDTFSAKLTLYLDKESASLADALFLGDRTNLGKTERDFKYIGAMHLLALSGLHLSVIVGSLERFLMRFGLGSKPRYILCMVVAGFYIALTGFIASAVRAAIMLAISYSAALIDRNGDRITALFAAVGLIILCDPTAVFDVSLQLSFGATLGLLLVAESAANLPRKKTDRQTRGFMLRKIMKLPGEIAVSLGAIMFVLPLQWLYFGEVSPTTVLSTLIITPICHVLLLLMPPLLICSLLSLHIPGGFIAGAVCVISELCTHIAASLAKHSVLVSLGYSFTLPIILSCIAVIVFMAMRGVGNWLYALVPFAISVTLFFGCVYAYDAVTEKRAAVYTVSYSDSEAITLVSNHSAAVISVGDGLSQTVYPTLDFLAEQYLTQVDMLILLTPSRRSVPVLLKLLNCRKVKRVLVPIPQNVQEAHLIADITALASEYGTQTELYNNSEITEFTHGEVIVNLSPRAELSRSSRLLTAVRFTHEDASTAYVCASGWENEEIWAFADGARYVILGAYGPAARMSPAGAISDVVEAVYVTDAEVFDKISPWTNGFSGKILRDKTFYFSLNP